MTIPTIHQSLKQYDLIGWSSRVWPPISAMTNRKRYLILLAIVLAVIIVYKLNNQLIPYSTLHIHQNYLLNKIQEKSYIDSVVDDDQDVDLSFHNISHLSVKEYQFIVLLWTKYFGSDSWSGVDLKTLNCSHSNCLLTDDRSRLSRSDAVFFHWRDINPRDLPHIHKSGQKWILYNWESPHYSPEYRIRRLASDIDWTMTYRRDSDIYVPYGSVDRCRRQWLNEDLFDGKQRNVAWIVSNCDTPGNREQYVQELQKYIDVDIYGSCGQYSCPRDDSCLQMLEKKYKFYLSFENSLCKDYITEKLFHIVEYDIIPVVYGSANYMQIMANRSVINVNDFRSPQELAEYLKELSNDKQKYNSYFKWKLSYCPKRTQFTYFCQMCRKLNEYYGKRVDHWKRNKLINWWFKEAYCRNPKYT
ncbi:glycoprotein 3-alpha-L-fucosyltransferase A-like [Oppia nitens]|uniref:glycoprotein 3-alpha-L-fucosyltransferase A-like n=1 Tax=Oppia nitens TaxID=1686743 RepID=UPI0023DBABAD|nr:glycoprotein 3-alpha-L-fucosyltransferase A-like [Oppia nitens]